MTIFFNEPSITQKFKMDDLVSWNKSLDCGPLRVEFFTKGTLPLPEEFFSWTQSSLTVKRQQLFSARSGHVIAFRVFFEKWPMVIVDSKREPIFIKILDPCIDKELRRRPSLCQA